MKDERPHRAPIPAWNLYGEEKAFPDVLHCERITDRAAGLDWTIAPHRHPWLHQFFLIRAGAVEMTADGRRLTPDPACVISVPRGVVHGFTFAAGTDGFVVTIPMQNLPEVFEAASPLSAPLARLAVGAADPGLTAEFEALHAEHEGRAPARAVMLRALAARLACNLIRHLPDAQGQASGPDPRIKGFEDLVQTHFRDGWSIDDYAAALGLSARHLGRLCQETTGQSAFVLLEQAVMREACRLLVYTRAGVASIGYQLGYEDPSYFSRAFRRHTGQTPRAYRAAFETE